MRSLFTKISALIIALTLIMGLTLVTACNKEPTTDDKTSQSTDGGTPDVEVPVSALPTLTFENKELNNNTLVLNVTNKSQIILPEYVAQDCFGKNLAEDKIAITHTFNGSLDDSVTYNAGRNSKNYYAVGKHEFSFKLTDATDAQKISNYKVLLNVYQSLFTNVGGDSMIDGELSDNPTFKSNNKGFCLNFFNMDRTSIYYAETTFDSVDMENYGKMWGIGMCHATENDASFALKDYYRIEVDGSWSHKYSRGFVGDSIISSDYYEARGIEDPKFTVADQKIVIAVARINDTFYSFLNGQLMDKYTYSVLSGRKTSAGICLIGNDATNPYLGYASNFKFVTGDQAITLVEGLTNKTSDFAYGRVLSNRKAVTFSENGFAFDKLSNYKTYNWWDCAVKSNVLFGGKTRIEFDYETTKAATDNGTVRIWIKKAERGDDPTNAQGFYHGMQLTYAKGNTLPTAVIPTEYRVEGGTAEHLGVLDADGNVTEKSFSVFNKATTKFHITILVEPLEGDNNAETKFTYTITEVGVDNPQSMTYSHFATQAAASVETEENNELFFLTFMTENVEYKVSNFTCTGLRVF